MVDIPNYIVQKTTVAFFWSTSNVCSTTSLISSYSFFAISFSCLASRSAIFFLNLNFLPSVLISNKPTVVSAPNSKNTSGSLISFSARRGMLSLNPNDLRSFSIFSYGYVFYFSLSLSSPSGLVASFFSSSFSLCSPYLISSFCTTIDSTFFLMVL